MTHPLFLAQNSMTRPSLKCHTNITYIMLILSMTERLSIQLKVVFKCSSTFCFSSMILREFLGL